MDKIYEIINNIRVKKPKRLLLKVRAGAKNNSIDGLIEIDNKEYLKISVKAQPKDGKANKMIIEFLAKELNLAKASLEIKVGKTSSYKIVKISS
jgi:uncharacterized protein (TIGR00251 family)